MVSNYLNLFKVLPKLIYLPNTFRPLTDHQVQKMGFRFLAIDENICGSFNAF